jgi:hypothetical protein
VLIENEDVIAKSGKSHHPMVRFTDRTNDEAAVSKKDAQRALSRRSPLEHPS